MTNVSFLQVVWHNYIMAMQKAGFSGNLGLYVASGLLTYGASDGESSHLQLQSEAALNIGIQLPPEHDKFPKHPI